MAIISRPVTIEEIKDYKQIRTPDYALLADIVNRAKGADRSMAQFAEDTKIGASTLSRIVNCNIKRPLSIETIIAIFEAREDKEDLFLLDSLARANGLHSKEYAERVNSRIDFAAKRNEEISRERMMKNALIAGVAACGMPVKEVVNRPRLCPEKIPMLYPTSYGDFMLDLRSELNRSIIELWAFYLFPRICQEERASDRELRFEVRRIVDKINVWFVLDAWDKEKVKGMKVSFAFVDERIFDTFKEYVSIAKLNNEMTVILIDPTTYTVIKEVWIPGNYDCLTNISVFEMPAPGAIDDNSKEYEEDDDYYAKEDDEW